METEPLPNQPAGSWLRNVFVNPIEKRLRGGWRLLLQAILFLGGSILAQILIGIAAGVYLLLSGANMQDPQIMMAITENTLVRLLITLTSLALALLSCALAARWFDKRRFRSFGFHFNLHWWSDLGFGLFLGAFLMLLIFLVEQSAGWISPTAAHLDQIPWWGLPVALIIFICVGISEELFSRGYQIRNLAESLNHPRVGPKTALLLAYLVTSLFFGLLHLLNQNTSLVSTLMLVVAGLFLGLAYVLTGELALPIGLHITWNFFQGNVFGFPVSGTKAGYSILQIQQAGPDLWTGGAFGPEAGLIGLAAIATGAILILAWVRLTRGKIGFAGKLAVYSPDQPAG